MSLSLSYSETSDADSCGIMNDSISSDFPSPPPSVVEIYDKSVFIPHVWDWVTKESLVYLFEFHFKIGKVERIESIPKTNQTDGHTYYSCFVFFLEWFEDSENTRILKERLHQQIPTKMNVNKPEIVSLKEKDQGKYIVVLPNTSENSQLDPPKHMDVMLYLPYSITPDVIFQVMEGLDLGKINGITIQPFYNPNWEETSVWKGANPDQWKKTVRFHYNVVFVHFEYWYRTNPAYHFQRELKEKDFVDIPTYEDMTWKFYESCFEPRTNGFNPYIWYRPESFPENQRVYQKQCSSTSSPDI